MAAATVAAALVLAITLALYVFGTRTFNYWRARGVRHDEPLPFFGNCARIFLLRNNLTQLVVELYQKYPGEKCVGLYKTLRPELVIKDPELIKRVLVADFTHFYSRGVLGHKTVIEPMLRNVFFADGDLWRLLRQRMTPAFSSGKLRAMFPLIEERAARLRARLLAAAPAALDARDLMARYTTDFIGACGFGLDSDSLGREDSAFRHLSARIFAITPRQVIITMLKVIFPELMKNMKVHDHVEKDITELVTEILRQRNYKPSGRHDFIDLLLECKEKGIIIGESIENIKSDGTPEIAELVMDDVTLVAQVYIFFAAGFETSSSATSFTLHQLAYNLDIQKKVQEEIDGVLRSHGNKLSYDAVKQMTLLECALKEGMRMFPPLGILTRQCVSKYTFPDVNLSIDEGVQIIIPVQALHNDPKYFDRPDVFRPERFHPDSDQSKHKDVYLPFGAGPRACIGERLGLMQSLAGLAAVLSCCSVEPAPTTIRHPKVNPKVGIVQTISGGLPLLFRVRGSNLKE